VKLEREQDDALVLQILYDFQTMLANLVVDEHATVVVHLLLAQPQLLRQHGQKCRKTEIQLLVLFYFIEPALIDLTDKHVVQVLLRTQLNFYVAVPLASADVGHYPQLHYLLHRIDLAVVNLAPHLQREEGLEKCDPVSAVHDRIEVRHPGILRFVI